MGFFGILSSFPGASVVFLVSLLIVIAASTQFTQKLEKLCEAFQLSIGLLSLLSAIGANIPNYVSSAIAIFAGHDDVGIGIIVGSNIYNIAIILGLCTFFSPERRGVTLDLQEKRDVRVIASYAVVISFFSILVIFWLPGNSILSIMHAVHLARFSLLLTAVGGVGIFAALLIHLFRRSHANEGMALHSHHHAAKQEIAWFRARLMGEVIFTLVVALSGVLVMVQSGQALTADVHMPPVLAGLLVLAIATSLPNTVVAISLVRTGEVAACIEEVCNSGSINIVLGIALPLCFWPGLLGDHFLLFLDAPLALVLTIGVLFWVVRGRISRRIGGLLLVIYVGWVFLHFWV